MTDDFWDGWEQLKKMFDYCRNLVSVMCVTAVIPTAICCRLAE